MKQGGLQSIAQELAAKGRNGDSILVHMQPRELLQMAQLAKMTGQPPLTVNPQTGLPEAFSWWKALLGAAALAAAPFTGGLSAALGFGALSAGTAAAIGTGIATIGGSLLSSGLKSDGTPASADEAQTAQIKKLQSQAQNFVDVPITRNIQSAAPSPRTGLPGVVPQPMGDRQEVTGYMKPATGFYAQGGQIGAGDHRVVIEAMAAVHGKHPNPHAALGDFRAKFGDHELSHFLQNMHNNNAAFEGLLSGPGAGMDDSIPAMVEGQKPVALSNDEYVVPADALAHLGDGSSRAGAKQMDAMIARLRQAKTGSAKQPGKINPAKVMPK